MKRVFTIIIITILCKSSVGQAPLQQYVDTVNHFSIQIPVGWKYGVNKSYPDLKLIAYRVTTDTSDKALENFNLNVIKRKNSSLEKQYAILVGTNREYGNFTLLDSGECKIQGLNYRWYIDRHENHINKMPMIGHVFVTYKNEETYILTFTTVPEHFDAYRKLFEGVANSLKFLP